MEIKNTPASNNRSWVKPVKNRAITKRTNVMTITTIEPASKCFISIPFLRHITLKPRRSGVNSSQSLNEMNILIHQKHQLRIRMQRKTKGTNQGIFYKLLGCLSWKLLSQPKSDRHCVDLLPHPEIKGVVFLLNGELLSLKKLMLSSRKLIFGEKVELSVRVKDCCLAILFKELGRELVSLCMFLSTYSFSPCSYYYGRRQFLG